MRLIDADAAITEWRRINNIDENDRGARFVGYTEIPRLLNRMPTIDAEPVVHCKDCKHYIPSEEIPHRGWCDDALQNLFKEDFYCGFGKRREP